MTAALSKMQLNCAAGVRLRFALCNRLRFVNRAEYDCDPAAGNLSAQKEYTTDVLYTLFADGFETQNLSQWSSSATDNGNLSVVIAAHLIDDQWTQVAYDVYARDYMQRHNGP